MGGALAPRRPWPVLPPFPAFSKPILAALCPPPQSLGYGVVVGSTMLKVPQIANVVLSGSARGLAPASLESTVVGFTIVLAYCIQRGLPFSSYGEAAFLLAQDLLLLGMVYAYNRTSALRVGAQLAAYLAFVFCLVQGILSLSAVNLLYDFHILVFIFARLPQIYKNYSSGSTGELSVISCGLLLVGNAVRIFTSRTEGSTSMLVGHLIGGALNLTILLQIFYYWPVKRVGKEKKRD